MVPRGYVVEEWLLVIVPVPEYVGVPRLATVAVHPAASAETVMSAGAIIVPTVTLLVQVAVLPATSVMVHVIAVVPVENVAWANEEGFW